MCSKERIRNLLRTVIKLELTEKNFEYSDIMHEILGKKKNVHPEMLLASETIDVPSFSDDQQVDIRFSDDQQVDIQSKPGVSKSDSQTTEVLLEKTIPAIPKKICSSRTRNLKQQILKEIRQVRQQYYKRRLEQEDKKVEEKG